ncbi:MAG: hypothetical protein CME19_18775 [Gemmatimonadetes bacterium]|nr:hypothetical protein [Gemmatimonadota bacterium]
MTQEIGGFVRKLGIVLVIGLVIIGLVVHRWLGMDALEAVLVGCLISTINVIVGVISIDWAFDKPQATFLKAILGGMAARMAAIFAALVMVVSWTDLQVFPLVGSMFGFYIVFQVLELRFVTQRTTDSLGD